MVLVVRASTISLGSTPNNLETRIALEGSGISLASILPEQKQECHVSCFPNHFSFRYSLNREQIKWFSVVLLMTTPLKETFPRCKRAARTRRMSEISGSEKSRTFMADRISANSLASFLPWHVVLFPCNKSNPFLNKAFRHIYYVRCATITPVRYLYWLASCKSNFCLSSLVMPASMQ